MAWVFLCIAGVLEIGFAFVTDGANPRKNDGVNIDQPSTSAGRVWPPIETL